MEPLLPSPAGPPLFLVAPGMLSSQVVRVTGPEGHHAAAVRRLRPGERADVTDGAGALAEGEVTEVGRDTVTLEIRSVRYVAPPEPRLAVAQALPKGDRGELAVELMTEIGVDMVIPWSAARSVTRWQAERGAKALGRWRATAREAAKQSRRPYLPEITEQATTAALAQRAAAAEIAVILEANAPGKFHELPIPAAGEILLLVGPEGGMSPEERTALRDAGAIEARLGPTVLRTSTAGAVAAAILLTRTPRW
jgi:16S rRNA (uracil1498-N3)-methyltransferase